MSCSGQKSPRFIPEAFEYPDDSIGQGKTFIYHDSLHNQDTYVELRSIVRERDTVQSYFRYNDTDVIDSQIVNHGKLMEAFRTISTLHHQLYKGEDIVDVTTDDGTKLGRHNESMTFHNDTVTATQSFESHFVKDTSILWSGRWLPCLVVQTNGKMEIRSKKYRLLNYTSRALLYAYYAKNIGVVKYVVTFKDRKNKDYYLPWTLTSIENGTKPIARHSPAP